MAPAHRRRRHIPARPPALAALAAGAAGLLPVAETGRGNCGLEVPLVPGAGEHPEWYEATPSKQRIPTDLEDSLWSLRVGERSKYERLRERCIGTGKAECRWYSVVDWNLTTFNVLSCTGVKGQLCEEDAAIYSQLEKAKSDPCASKLVVCADVDGKLRIVGIRGPLTRRNLAVWSRLPRLFTLSLPRVYSANYTGMSLPPSVQVVEVLLKKTDQLRQIGALLRAQGKVRSLMLGGPKDTKRYLKVDLSELCGLDLVHFSGGTLNVGHIPECWGAMKNLRLFYCTACMMTKAPTALRGSASLRSFIAFRQWEMIPCAVGELSIDPSKCKPSWETRALLVPGGRAESTGEYQDAGEGPIYLCPEASYAMSFTEFLDLNWTNVEKVWLDANFITGTIPDRIAQVWPAIDSLDLYDNDMEGTIPESLGGLPFTKLQLQANRFSGTLPPRVASLLVRQGLTLGLAGNRDLHGCLPPGSAGMGLTQLRHCADGGAGEEL